MVRLADLTTLRLGGPARSYVEVTTEPELIATVADADRRGEPVLILGGGSNLVVGDAGFDGVVIAVRTRGRAARRRSARRDAATLEVAAGEVWDDLVERAVASGWSGLECLAGIPGLVGASPIQNVGAYGQEMAAVTEHVRIWDRARGEVRTLPADACGFGYRHSRFKAEPGRFVVLSVRFVLPVEDRSAPIRYAELCSALGIDLGERVPLDSRPQRGARAAVAKGDGARSRRPRHLERGLVLHQPGARPLRRTRRCSPARSSDSGRPPSRPRSRLRTGR